MLIFLLPCPLLWVLTKERECLTAEDVFDLLGPVIDFINLGCFSGVFSSNVTFVRKCQQPFPVFAPHTIN